MKAFGAARRGRPKAERALSDQGTPELQAMRRRLAAGGDPALAENPLSVLLARGLIDAEQHAAGFRYAALYRGAVARTSISSDRIYTRIGGGSMRGAQGSAAGIDEARIVETRSRYLASRAELARAGLPALRAVESIAVFGEWPDFLAAAPARFANDNLSRAAIRRIMRLRVGLDALSGTR